MLRGLSFSMVTYTLITVTSTLVTLLAMPAWGRHSDSVGNVQVIKLSSLMICILPALWIVSPYKPYLFFIQIIGGFAWSGFNIAVTNFIYDVSAEHQRIGNFAFFNLLNGLGICLGALCGGFIIPHLPMIFESQILTLFALSTLLRCVAVAFLSGIKEVKQVQTVGKYALLLSLIGIRPLKM
jgi:MFS family permease